MKKLIWMIPALSLVSCHVEREETEVQDKPAPADKPTETVPEVKQTASPAFDVNKSETLVGQPLAKVEPALEEAGIRYRVVERDGQSLPVTMDYRPDRLNFKVRDGVVIGVTNG